MDRSGEIVARGQGSPCARLPEEYLTMDIPEGVSCAGEMNTPRAYRRRNGEHTHGGLTKGSQEHVGSEREHRAVTPGDLRGGPGPYGPTRAQDVLLRHWSHAEAGEAVRTRWRRWCRSAPCERGSGMIRLAKLAQRKGLRLVPRGWATSGYGGVLPQSGAIVVDMSGHQRVLSVDAENMTVRTEAGAIWENIDREIGMQGLALRMYPSSYPSSSVAGWLAQGGSGFGSYEYGTFKDNVVSARVVLPTGEVREFTGDDLNTLVADAEGITGIITEVEFRVRTLEAEVHLVAFKTAAELGKALSAISAEAVPIWSITFLNPESTRLKKQLPHHHGHPYEMAHEHFEPNLPEAFLAVIAYPEPRRGEIDSRLARIIDESGGTELDGPSAEHEWEQRFAPMRLKRIGPSIEPTEVVVPLAEMPAVLGEIDQKIHQPFILEGMVGKGDYVVLLGFIPHDERSLAFNLAFALSLSVIKIAKAHGGAAYSTGLYFRGEAASVLGAEKLAAIKAYKAKVDPSGAMNPGKVYGSGMVDLLMGSAMAFETIVRNRQCGHSLPAAPATAGP